MLNMFKSLIRDEEGATMVEYGLMLGLIAAVCIAAVTTLGTTVNGIFTYINTQLAGVP